MIVSVNWLKEFTDINLPIGELAGLIGSRLVEIEEVIDLGIRYERVVVAKVAKVEDHPDADRLHIVEIDDARQVKEVERLENGNVQVVCGAPNVRAGLLVAWLPPGSVVPSTFMDAEPFILDSRKLRGVMSHGMIASPKELAFSDDHTGILEIDKKDAAAGDSFAKLYELDDYLLDIENKSLTHRPDCFGLIGFAREVAAIQGQDFETPTWLKALEPRLGDKKAVDGIKNPRVTVENPEIAPRYEAVILANINVTKQSPAQIQSFLSRVGMRPISAVVDITNYLMLLTGQPLHAFDYDKFVTAGGGDEASVTVREAREGEKLTLLDGKEISLASDDIIICSGTTPVALAGAMGGASTEIDENTRNILLESATFDLFRLRATQMRHGIFSEAITRFTKGQPPALTAPVLASAVRMFCDITDATRATDIVDMYPEPTQQPTLKVPLEKINGVLGSRFSMLEALRPLGNAEFTTTATPYYTVVATPPYWRSDIHIEEDVIEEIGRLKGFDNIEPTLPERDFKAVQPSKFDKFRTHLRQTLTRAGANEVLNYNFVHGDLLKRASQSPEKAFKLANAMSPDLQYYRLSLTPGILEKVYPNLRQRFESFALYEIGKVHEKEVPDDHEPDVPAEFHSLALTLAATPKQAKGTAFYNAKYILEYLMKNLGLKATYHSYVIDDIVQPALSLPFETKRTAIVRVNAETIGVVGEYKASTLKAFKLPAYAAGFELDILKLFEAVPSVNINYAPLSRFPGTEQDICVQVPLEVQYQTIVDVARNALSGEKLEWDISPIDIYQPENADTKNITIRVSLVNHKQTISTSEASVVIAYLSEAFQAAIAGAKII
ncbi:phenylalanyl-tRNA synthetase, beta subunit [candidate division TM7 genomosp. GTL1]|nr:phenylalanyl-tRNA synthetase, beta subunit [candidate division TM7 genomosp. GTL1]